MNAQKMIGYVAALVLSSVVVGVYAAPADPFATPDMLTNAKELCDTSDTAPYPAHSYQYVAMQGCAIIMGNEVKCPYPWTWVKQNAVSNSPQQLCSHEAGYENDRSSLRPFIQRDLKVCIQTNTDWKSCPS